MMKYLILLLPLLFFAEWSADTMKVPCVQLRTLESDSVTIGSGVAIAKIVKVNSHLAIITVDSDTLWAASDTTGF